MWYSSFYYVDERNADGQPAMGRIDGPAYGEFCFELAQQKDQGSWDATFVNGAGYKDFSKAVFFSSSKDTSGTISQLATLTQLQSKGKQGNNQN